MILIGLGSNLTTEQFKSSKEVIEAALKLFADYGIDVIKISKFYETEPVPKSDQPWFVNVVASVATKYNASELLRKLHAIENELGRVRRERWEARTIDLDLLCYNKEIIPEEKKWLEVSKYPSYDQPIIPHSRLHERDFVLIPLLEISKEWKHPVLKKTALQMLTDKKSNEIVKVLG